MFVFSCSVSSEKPVSEVSVIFTPVVFVSDLRSA